MNNHPNGWIQPIQPIPPCPADLDNETAVLRDEEPLPGTAGKRCVERVEEKLDIAISALSDVITEILKTNSPSRFAEVARLSGLAQQLQTSKAQRVGNVEQEEYPLGMNVIGANPYVYQPQRLNAINLGGAGQDAHQLTREIMGMLGPQTELQAISHKASVARDEAAELESNAALLKALDKTSPVYDVLERRTAQITENIKRRLDESTKPEKSEKREP